MALAIAGYSSDIESYDGGFEYGYHALLLQPAALLTVVRMTQAITYLQYSTGL